MSATATASSPGEILQFVSFHVDEEEFGLEILRVQEIIRIQPLTRVPASPAFVEGVINLRGRIIPVVSLRQRFGLAPREPDKLTRIIVTEVSGTVLGFMVDAVSEVLRLPMSTVEPPPRLGRVEREYVRGVANLDNRLLILLDIDRLMSEAEEEVCVEMTQA
jgi:purine-binding chemotaxis protein CheW